MANGTDKQHQGGEGKNDEASAVSTEVDRDKDFDLEYMAQCFERCVDDNSIVLRIYNRGFAEMNKMLGSMGLVFGFVVSELNGRIKKLDEYRHGPDKRHYRVLREMLRYEVNEVGITSKRKNWVKSGTRHFLNLHRGLKFFTLFMENAKNASPNSYLNEAAVDAYDNSLARYHGMVLRGVARLAMKSLPTKDGMAKNIFGKAPDRVQKMEEIGGRAIQEMKKAYAVTKENFSISTRLNSSKSMGP